MAAKAENTIAISAIQTNTFDQFILNFLFFLFLLKLNSPHINYNTIKHYFKVIFILFC